MKKIKIIKITDLIENSMLEIEQIYFYSGLKRSYGYDILDMNYDMIYSFGNSCKKDFDEVFEEIPLNLSEKIKLFLVNIKMRIYGEINKLRYHTFNNKNIEKIILNSYDINQFDIDYKYKNYEWVIFLKEKIGDYSSGTIVIGLRNGEIEYYDEFSNIYLNIVEYFLKIKEL